MKHNLSTLVALAGIIGFGLSGCLTRDGTPSLNINDGVRMMTGRDPRDGRSDGGDAVQMTPMARAIILGGGIAHAGNQVAAQTGNPAYETAGNVLAQAATKDIDYQEQARIAQQAASQQPQSVYVNQTAPVQPVYQTPAQPEITDRIYPHVFNDLNGNHIVDSYAEVGPQQYNFFMGEGAVFEITNLNNLNRNVRVEIKKGGVTVIKSDFSYLPAGYNQMIAVPILGTAGAGDYQAIASDSQGNIIDKAVINVKPLPN